MKNETGIHPLGHAVLVEAYDVEASLGASRIIIPENIRSQYKILENKVRVLEAGPFAWADETEPRAKPGDVVLVVKHTGAIVASPKDGKLYRMVSDRDIYCRFDVPEAASNYSEAVA